MSYMSYKHTNLALQTFFILKNGIVISPDFLQNSSNYFIGRIPPKELAVTSRQRMMLTSGFFFRPSFGEKNPDGGDQFTFSKKNNHISPENTHLTPGGRFEGTRSIMPSS